MTDNVYVEPDRDKKTIHMFVRKTVVKAEDLYEPEEITLRLTRTKPFTCLHPTVVKAQRRTMVSRTGDRPRVRGGCQ